MHWSAHNKMKENVLEYITYFENPRILDVGSREMPNQKLKHTDFLSRDEYDYVGLDVIAGINVDFVLEESYTFPFENESFDIILSGQVLEHIPFPWASMLEMARVLKTEGLIFITAPSRGHVHSHPTDCWRYYPDAYKALAAFTNLNLVKAETDFPSDKPGTNWHEYSSIPDSHYWGDSLGIFQKPEEYDDKLIEPVRKTIIEWSNRHSDLNAVSDKFTKNIPTSVDTT